MFGRFRKSVRNEEVNPSTYEPTHYWDNIAGPFINSKELTRQQKNIMKHIQPLDFASVYEVGVGEGRISKPILDLKNISKYDGSDMSNLRIKIVQEKLKQYPQFNVEYGSFQNVSLHKTYDLVLASEVLMHITPEDIKDVIKKMLIASKKYVINIDYFESKESTVLAKHNFLHNYPEIYTDLGFTVLRHELPYKQSLFIVKK